MFAVRIVTLNLRCYLMVVFCLISTDFAACSLALHKHLVGVVVKRLRTFESLALSTLTPMFFILLSFPNFVKSRENCRWVHIAHPYGTHWANFLSIEIEKSLGYISPGKVAENFSSSCFSHQINVKTLVTDMVNLHFSYIRAMLHSLKNCMI